MELGFEAEKRKNISLLGTDAELNRLALDLMRESGKYKYTYNFTWLGRPVIQFPQDLMAMQEIIWAIRPDLIIETGIAHGGGLLFYASMLELVGGEGRVLGIDVEIRPHNREAIEQCPVQKRVSMIEGSSTDQRVVERVAEIAKGKRQVLVALDSNHTHAHVLRELELYSQFVTPGSYLVVFDTTIEDQPEGFFAGRPWGKTNNPKTAVRQFLRRDDRFVVDKEIEGKLLLTCARDGYLRRARP